VFHFFAPDAIEVRPRSPLYSMYSIYIMRNQPRMRVATVRKDGSEYDVHWVKLEPPTVVAYRGLARLHQHVNRALRSPSAFSSVIISRPDGNVAISVWKLKGVVSIGSSFNVPADARFEAEFRALASQKGESLIDDYLANDGRVRMLRAALAPDCDRVTLFAHRLLHDHFGIRRLAPLHYSYEEREVI
jgi:hypothetical protein